MDGRKNANSAAMETWECDAEGCKRLVVTHPGKTPQGWRSHLEHHSGRMYELRTFCPRCEKNRKERNKR